ncbi:Versicolorin reductase 1 [Venturia nashicola]|uniref:Versicolorin reductase 1 n=1 Tax=Venturia nashicola TaxID=86259 RepID=A0A4Z1PLE0_9PEZI|nr:Versicolorin reductase 1 [Venturia nashicola]
MSLSGKVALITGGTKGIGKATAQKFIVEGASVVVNYGRDAAAAEALVQEVGSDRFLAVQGDAGKISDIEKIIAAAVKKFGKLDIVMANAGVMPMKDLEHITEEDYERVMTLNVKGPLFLAQKAVPHMAPGSSLILVSTTLAVASTVAPGYLPYLASKGAIEQMTRVLAKDLGTKGIRVNAIAPGPTGTDLFLEGKPEQMIQGIAKASPFNKLGLPEEIADVAAFVAGDASRWLSGQIVRVNGAMA